MNAKELVDNAKGEVFPGALRKAADWEGDGNFGEWSPAPSPLEYIEHGEQPHFMWVQSGEVVKITTGYNANLSEKS
jgi:hypothetical protein